MKESIRLQRTADAQARVEKSARKLARQYGLEKTLVENLSVTDRFPDNQALFRLEAVANILEGAVKGNRQGAREDEEIEEELTRLRAEQEILLRENALLKAERESDLPADFPGRNPLLLSEKLTVEMVRGMSRDDLIALEGIGEVTADKILAALAEMLAPATPTAPTPEPVAPAEPPASLAETNPSTAPAEARASVAPALAESESIREEKQKEEGEKEKEDVAATAPPGALSRAEKP